MRPKKILPVLTTGIAIGFIVGFVYIFKQLRASLIYTNVNRYIQYRMMRLGALSFQDSLYKWLKITIVISLTFFIIWLLWKLFLSRIIGIRIKHRIKWKILKVKWKNIFKVTKPIKKIALVSVMLLVILNLGIIIDSKINIPNKPNVILIVCETLRADHIGYHRYKRDITNNIDSFANNACIFKNAYTQAPCTKPSMWNIVTSRYQSATPAEDEYVTIAEHFKSNNYKTSAFISQQFLEEKKSNLNQGFDVYDAKCKRDDHGLSVRKATSVTDAAIKWIDQNKKYPFFAWLVYFDPHDPYIPPSEFRGYYNKTEKFSGDRRADKIHMISKPIPEEHRQFLINAYDEEIRYFDYELGRLFAYLKSSDRYNNSIIILTADHGEELGDNVNIWDHCQLLSQEEIWIPLLIKMPWQEKKIVIDEAVQNIDIYPTLVEYFNGRHLPSYYDTLEGRSLVSLINEEQLNDNRFAVSFWQGQRCIIKGNYKYWLREGKEYLIDTKTKKKITNVALLNSFRKQLDKMYNQYILKKEYYKETVDRLRSLGYIKK